MASGHLAWAFGTTASVKKGGSGEGGRGWTDRGWVVSTGSERRWQRWYDAGVMGRRPWIGIVDGRGAMVARLKEAAVAS